jgi:hypothetical protein
MKRFNVFRRSLCAIVFIAATAFAQQWQQVGTPIGGGITDLTVDRSGNLWATTGSFNYPSIQGGIFASSNAGQTWERKYNAAFTARTIVVAPDNYLYASIWLSPTLQEGIATSPPGLFSPWVMQRLVAAGDNVFSIAPHPTNAQILYAGTRNGVLRTTNHGTNWTPMSTGIPDSTWVRALAVDSSGIVAAGTTRGLYISTDVGASWTRATGINDTVTALLFDDTSSTASLSGGNRRLLAGTNHPPTLYEAFNNAEYLSFTLLALFVNGEIADVSTIGLRALNRRMHGVEVFSSPPSSQTPLAAGIYFSTDGAHTFTLDNQGLPPNARTAALAGVQIGNTLRWFAGLYQDTIGGARVYRKDIVTAVNDKDPSTPSAFELKQNYPNPFNPATHIPYSVQVSGFTSLKVFDVLGREVATLVNEVKAPGSYEATWDPSASSGQALASGVYYYKLVAGGAVATKKMILAK